MVMHACNQLLRRLRQKNHLSQEGRDCDELRLHHCTPAWAKTVKLCLKKKGYLLPKAFPDNPIIHIENVPGQVWWLSPVIPTLWEDEAGRS